MEQACCLVRQGNNNFNADPAWNAHWLAIRSPATLAIFCQPLEDLLPPVYFSQSCGWQALVRMSVLLQALDGNLDQIQGRSQ